MKSRLLFREHGQVIRTRTPADWWWGAVAALFLVAIYGLAQVLDRRADAADAEALALAQSAGFARGLNASHGAGPGADTLPQLRRAYEAGLSEGLAALRERPEGLALAQACAARGGRP